MLAGEFKPGNIVTGSVALDESGKQELRLEVTSAGALTAAEDEIAEELLEMALA
jgi:hypothetical protein